MLGARFFSAIHNLAWSLIREVKPRTTNSGRVNANSARRARDRGRTVDYRLSCAVNRLQRKECRSSAHALSAERARCIRLLSGACEPVRLKTLAARYLSRHSGRSEEH